MPWIDPVIKKRCLQGCPIDDGGRAIAQVLAVNRRIVATIEPAATCVWSMEFEPL